MRKIFIFLSALMLFCTMVLGQEKNITFENANSAYNTGQFEKAVMLYKEILESSKSFFLLISEVAV